MAEITEQHVRQFEEARREFAKKHPDYDDVLADAAKRKLDLTPDQTREIFKLGRPDVPYYLALKENESRAREINGVKGERGADLIRREASRLDRHNTFPKKSEGKENPTDVYLRGRKYDIKQGLRRR